MDSKTLSHVLKIRKIARAKRLTRRWPDYATEQPGRGHATDAELVQAMANGDRQALQLLYQRYALTLVSFAEQILANPAEAEDLLQDVFLEAWRKADTYDARRGGVQNWLLVRLRSRAIDRLKSADKRLVSRAGTIRSTELLSGDDPENNYFAMLARRAFLALPQRRRDLLGLLHVLELSHTEAAESLGCAIGTVKSRSLRFMKALRELNVGTHQPVRSWS